jgi:hypothetical protein
MSEIQIRLPDGQTLEVPEGSTVLDVSQRIGKKLARAASAGRIDGQLVDLRVPLESDTALEIVTAGDPAAGEVIRHSAEHVMADAVKRLFPDVQIDVGRADHSEKFQYDFLVDRPFTPEDLEKIEKEMLNIIDEGAVFTRQVVSRDEAIALFEGTGEELKVSRIGDVPDGEDITLFRHGEFVDLCRGPHVQRVGQIGAVKLLEAAGAYWRGDESNPMLQRIYGTAFATGKELSAYLAAVEEAKKRDHRRVGSALDLFHIDPLSPGSPFYHPKGTVLYNGLVDYIKALYPKYGYQEVITPQIFRTDLFKISGHYDLFREDMFLMEGDEGEEMGVKPMNCPGHCRLFAHTKRSYRDLPLRFAEFSRLHRNERSGTLTGLSRVRTFSQDDAHIYCERERVPEEIQAFFEMTRAIHRRSRRLGPGREGAHRVGGARGLPLRHQGRGGGLLRSQGGVRLRGRAGPGLDPGHRADRPGDAGALRSTLHRPRRKRSRARHAASSGAGLVASSTRGGIFRFGSPRCRSWSFRSRIGTWNSHGRFTLRSPAPAFAPSWTSVARSSASRSVRPRYRRSRSWRSWGIRSSTTGPSRLGVGATRSEARRRFRWTPSCRDSLPRSPGGGADGSQGG